MACACKGNSSEQPLPKPTTPSTGSTEIPVANPRTLQTTRRPIIRSK